ncbi:hypothetical protein [Nonomuraea sp. NPDC046570]|uniref:hypothetical protein n=1 Tax=Nonomuraea sp. NPDC046570 TaxID=3155255 RepID=UPI0033CD201F
MSQVSAGIAVYDPRAEEMHLNARSGWLFLTVARNHVWFALNHSTSDGDVEAEAAAMDRLAELAVEAAARLRALAAAPAIETAPPGRAA